MEDYLEEINTALSTTGENYFFQSVEDVQKDLEQEASEYGEKAIKYGTFATGLSAAGITGKAIPEFYTQTADKLELLTQNEISTIGLIGALGVSTIPAYLAKKNKDKRDDLKELAQKLENGEFDENDPEFAYEIAEKL